MQLVNELTAFVASLVVAVVDYFFAIDLQHHVAHALAPSCGVV